MAPKQVVVSPTQIIARNGDGCYLARVYVDFRGMTRTGARAESLIDRSLTLALAKLHRDAKPRGLFRYVVKSNHFAHGLFPFNEFKFKKTDTHKLLNHITSLRHSPYLYKVFRDILTLECTFIAK